MQTFLITFVLFVLFVLFMSLGVLAGRAPIKGTCGGLNRIKGLKSACAACGGADHCEKRRH